MAAKNKDNAASPKTGKITYSIGRSGAGDVFFEIHEKDRTVRMTMPPIETARLANHLLSAAIASHDQIEKRDASVAAAVQSALPGGESGPH